MVGTRRKKSSRQKFAVEKFGVEDFILKMYKANVPVTKMSQRLTLEKDVTISPLGINRWLKQQREEDGNAQALQSKEKFDIVIMDYKNELKTILDEVKEMKEVVKEKGDIKFYDKMIGRLYQGIELLAKLSGDVKQKGSIDINIIINELNTRAFDEHRKLRNVTRGFGTGEVVDVESEITTQDKKKQNELKGKK